MSIQQDLSPSVARESYEQTCKSCGNNFIGEYCNICGEKVLRPADKSFRTLLSNILIAITFADSKFIKTLWLVIKNPGFVSREFAEGRRIKYLKVLSLFFVLNLVYFFFPVIQLFNASLTTQLRSPLGSLYQTMIAHKIINLHMDVSSISLVYNLKSTALAKLMVMIFVVIGSLPLNLIYSKPNRFFADHVGYMVELACFNLFINTMVLAILAHFLGLGHYLDDKILTGIFIATNLYFLVRSGMVFYQERGWKLILKSFAMILFLKLALELYRIILFFVTLWSL